MEKHNLKKRVVDVLNNLTEGDVDLILEYTQAINDFFEDETGANKDLVSATQHHNFDELVDKYGESVIYATLVNKLNKGEVNETT